jgi:predicted MPP superfamily phosphohydrolase
MNRHVLEKLETRLGRLHARQRLGIENDKEAHVFRRGTNFFHIENWYSIHSVIRNTLKVSGLYWRGLSNTARIRVLHNDIALPGLPAAFEGFTILHISDMHVDINENVMHRLIELLQDLSYDLCVLTGDYRGKTFGSYEETLQGMERVRLHLKSPVYGVLGNHDTIRMVPGLEDMGIQMLINESETLEVDSTRIHLVGIDDAHYYRVDNIEKAVSGIPHEEMSILLSHTPEIYRQAAHADVNLLLGGHTHGGQICLPGSIPITLDSTLPRHMGSGAWKYRDMIGYTSVGVGSSVVTVRFNCLPEITLHHLRAD